MSVYETTLTELKRKGDSEKVRWLEGLNQKITPSQKQRIQKNDTKVMQDIFAPKWVSWDIIYAWATSQEKEKECIICNTKDLLGMEIKGKFLCANCFIEIKHKQ